MASANEPEHPESDVPEEEEMPTVVPESSTSRRTSVVGGKAAVPPKRPLTAPKRPTAPTPATAAKATAATASRAIPGSTLSKPPTRPPPSSTVRRPAAPASSSTLSHRPRHSTSSIEEVQKGPSSPRAETKRPLVSGAAKRASLTPSTASRLVENKPPASSTARRLPGANSSATERKLVSSGKEPLRSAGDSSRNAAATTTPRTARSSTLTKPGSSSVAEGKKRLSTIPASPASQATPSPAKPERPALGARKSTMSAMTEQRLKEFELVQNMLKIAMAQDGADEEVKEEYAKQMDENLATLKKDLVEARRAEGIETVEEETFDHKPDEGGQKTVETLEAELATSREKITSLEADLADSKQMMDQFSSQTEEALKVVDASKEDMQRDHEKKINELKATHAAELEKFKAKQLDKDDLHDNSIITAKEALAKDHATELDLLRSQHAGELETLKAEIAKKDELQKQYAEQSLRELDAAKTAASEQGSAELSKLLEERKEQHSKELDAVNEKYELEQKQGKDATTKVSELSSEILELKTQLAEAQKTAADDAAAQKMALETDIKTRDDRIATLETHVTTARKELNTLKDSHAKELDEFQATSTERIRSAQADHEASRKKVVELETAADSTSSEHDKLLASKESEIQQHLQKMQDLEKVISVAASEHEQTLVARDAESQSLSEKVRQLEEITNSTTTQHAEDISGKEAEIANSLQKIKDLEGAAGVTSTTHEKFRSEKATEIEALQQKLRETEAASGSASVRQEELLKQIKDLQEELKEVTDAKEAELEMMLKENQALSNNLEQAREALQEVQALRRQLEAFENRTQELEATGEDQMTKYQATISAKTAEVQKLEAAVQSLQEQVENLHENKRDELDEAKASMKQSHDAAIEQMRLQHRGEMEAAIADIDGEQSKLQAKLTSELEEATKTGEASQKRNDELLAELQGLKSISEKAVNDLTQEKTTMLQAQDRLKKDLEDSSARVSELNKTLETFDQASQGKEQQHAASLKKLREDLERTSKALEERTKDGESLIDKHNAALESLQSQHAEKLAKLESDTMANSTELERLKTEHEAQAQESEQKHARELAEAKEAHQKAASAAQGDAQNLRDALAAAEHQVRSNSESHATANQELKDKHSAEIEELHMQLAQSKFESATAREQLESVGREHGQIESLRKGHAVQLEERERAYQAIKVTIAELSGKLSNAERALEDTSQVDALRQENTNLNKTHDAQLAEMQSQMAVEADKREKEKQSGAAVRDKLVKQLEELEGIRQQYPAAKEEADKYQADAQAARRELEEVRLELSKALSAHNEKQMQSAAELQASKEELEKTKRLSNRRSRSNSGLRRDLEGLRSASDKERGENAQLKQQLEEATTSIERHAARVREVEASLKATKAEIVELKTKAAKPKSPASGGLQGSQWAAEKDDDGAGPGESVEESEGTEKGSHIEGAMAGLQAQLKALADLNEDIMGDHRRQVLSYDGQIAEQQPRQLRHEQQGDSALVDFEPVAARADVQAYR